MQNHKDTELCEWYGIGWIFHFSSILYRKSLARHGRETLFLKFISQIIYDIIFHRNNYYGIIFHKTLKLSTSGDWMSRIMHFI